MTYYIHSTIISSVQREGEQAAEIGGGLRGHWVGQAKPIDSVPKRHIEVAR